MVLPLLRSQHCHYLVLFLKDYLPPLGGVACGAAASELSLASSNLSFAGPGAASIADPILIPFIGSPGPANAAGAVATVAISSSAPVIATTRAIAVVVVVVFVSLVVFIHYLRCARS